MFIHAYKEEAVHYFRFGTPLSIEGLIEKKTVENKGSNVLFGIIKFITFSERVLVENIIP